tara:strand:+ start:475 stop:723 length:249 start_codon:yes stop_codon:yes gene_type:complete
MENVYEHFFYLQYTGGWSFTEAYNLPVGLRTWFVKRLSKQIEAENEQHNGKSSGGSNRPEAGKRTYSLEEASAMGLDLGRKQ